MPNKFHSAFWIVLGIIAFLIFYNNSLYFTQHKWLKIERQQMLERVQAVGGWDALRKDCISLATRCGNESGNWSDRDTNGLPAAIIALKPRRVEFYPANFDKGKSEIWFNDSDVPIVRITIFSEFYTGPGGSDKPPMGFDILCETSTGQYNPQRLQAATPLKYWSYKKITDEIYEFYGFF
jgi:hypothetical protein